MLTALENLSSHMTSCTVIRDSGEYIQHREQTSQSFFLHRESSAGSRGSTLLRTASSTRRSELRCAYGTSKVSISYTIMGLENKE